MNNPDTNPGSEGDQTRDQLVNKYWTILSRCDKPTESSKDRARQDALELANVSFLLTYMDLESNGWDHTLRHREVLRNADLAIAIKTADNGRFDLLKKYFQGIAQDYYTLASKVLLSTEKGTMMESDEDTALRNAGDHELNANRFSNLAKLI